MAFKSTNRTKQLFAAPFVVFLLMMVVFPLLLVLIYAFVPKDGGFTLKYFGEFFTDGYSMKVLGRSLWVAFVSATICILIGYPIAYILAQTKFKRAPMILMLFILPMWINTLLRTFAAKQLLYLFTNTFGYTTLIFGLVMDYLPFMIMPLYVVLSNINKHYIEASRDLGAPPFKVFTKTILPLSVPGIISGFLMVFTPAVSTYFMSEYLGNSNTRMFGQLLNDLYSVRNFGKGSVLALVLLLIVGLSVLATNKFTKMGNKRGGLW